MTLSIVREQKSTYGETGNVSESAEVYIKLARSFKPMLKQFKGARLHVFICVALHEADIMLGDAEPLTLSSIQRITDYSRPIITSALDYLIAGRFLTELDERGEAGEKQYRVCAFAWYGRGKVSLPQFETVQKTLLEKNFISSSSSLSNSDMGNKSTTTISEAVEKILTAVNLKIAGLDLSTMTVERAELIAAYVLTNPEKKRSPAGWVYTLLKNNPDWQPVAKQSTWYDDYKDLVQR